MWRRPSPELHGRPAAPADAGSHQPGTARTTSTRTCPTSSGTCSLVGVGFEKPVLSQASRQAGLTNEHGVDGRVRHLCNVMDLWPLQESQRTWAAHWLPADLPDLLAAAAPVPAFTVVVSRPRLHVTAAQRGGRVAVHHPLKGLPGLIGAPVGLLPRDALLRAEEVDAVSILRVVR